MEENVYVFGGKTTKFKATKRYVRFENFPSFIHCSDSKRNKRVSARLIDGQVKPNDYFLWQLTKGLFNKEKVRYDDSLNVSPSSSQKSLEGNHLKHHLF